MMIYSEIYLVNSVSESDVIYNELENIEELYIYEELHNIIINNKGKDISRIISNITLERLSVSAA